MAPLPLPPAPLTTDTFPARLRDNAGKGPERIFSCQGLCADTLRSSVSKLSPTAVYPGADENRASWPRFDTVLTSLFALAGWKTGLAPLSDNSFLCHLRTGRWILDHGIPRADVFSFTAAGHRWVDESWLADLIYGFLDARWGASGVTALNAVTCAAIAALWYRLALRLCGDRVNALALTALSLGASWTIWSPRPLLIGVLAFLVLVWIVESGVSGTAMAAVVPLMWIWANIHGSFLLGFGYVGLHLLGDWMQGIPPWEGRQRQLVLWIAAAFAACFANPYGVDLIAAPFHLIAHHSVLRYVTEWRPIEIRSVQAPMYAAWLVVFAWCEAKRSGRRLAGDLIVTLPFIALGMWAARNIAIAPIVTTPSAARAIRGRSRNRPDSNPALNAILAALLLLLAGWWTLRAFAEPRFDWSSYPVGAMHAVESRGLLGRRMFSTDAWGDYILYAYWPRQRVFMDDRYDLYPPQVFHDMFVLLNGSRDWHRVLERYRIEVVVWPATKSSIDSLAHEPGWSLIYKDEIAVVYVRSDSESVKASDKIALALSDPS